MTDSDPLVWFALRDGPLQGDALRARVAGPDAGCVVEFRGTVRGTARGLEVERLEYEAYSPMVEAELRKIAAEIRARHDFADSDNVNNAISPILIFRPGQISAIL